MNKDERCFCGWKAGCGDPRHLDEESLLLTLCLFERGCGLDDVNFVMRLEMALPDFDRFEDALPPSMRRLWRGEVDEIKRRLGCMWRGDQRHIPVGHYGVDSLADSGRVFLKYAVRCLWQVQTRHVERLVLVYGLERVRSRLEGVHPVSDWMRPDVFDFTQMVVAERGRLSLPVQPRGGANRQRDSVFRKIVGQA